MRPSCRRRRQKRQLAGAECHGLHARPAARLAEALAHFDAELVLEKGGQRVDPRSLNQLALLQVGHGDTIRLSADGRQADEALRRLTRWRSSTSGSGFR
ncbi:PTS-dependent dihydroxyacetone kinase, phosphotransferase subunit dhaM [Serratia rubidaea]|uniref:Phosphocarrier protein NPr n=1 Tax=Serratia rubidaea TaxID=61652 RepID=A0A447QJH4_SERRU|nr:PTS-dependent dihydroxyacetone kinase, phosphotransferase subunit dhaM [Serratia rubidaea]